MSYKYAIHWIASKHKPQTTYAIILTDSKNLLQKVVAGMGCPNWHTAMNSLRLRRLLWIYCPGHAGVRGNERAEVLRGLRNFLNVDRPEHHNNHCLMERRMEKGRSRHSTLRDQERSELNHTNISTVSKTSLRLLQRNGGGAHKGLSKCCDAILSKTETELIGTNILNY